MQTTVKMPGIHCKSCEMLIRDVSADFPQITSMSFDFEKKEIQMNHAEGFDLDKWSRAVSDLGPEYEVKTA